MLDLTLIARGKIKLRLRKADAHELVQSAMEIVRSNIENQHLKLSVALLASHYELNIIRRAWSRFFGTSFATLANSPRKTARSLSDKSQDPNPRRITIEISDNGIGIEPEFVGKVFAAFEKADSRSEGLGFGLAISKAIVEMHAGFVWCTQRGTRERHEAS